MTTIYFVRHAQPVYNNDDRNRPLSDEGREDRRILLDTLKDEKIDAFYCSPYKRSMETISELAEYFHMEIHTDERLRERQAGSDGNGDEMFQKRWADFDFHEEGGESLNMVQNRNISALFDILDTNDNKTLVIGTHGTALSTILNYYDSSFDCEAFRRIVDWMPYVIRLDFEGHSLVDKVEIAHIYKEYKEN